MRTLFACFVTLIATCSHVYPESPSVAIVVEEEATPIHFDYIGTYLVKSIVRVHAGSTTSSPITDTRYRVYSSGKEIRIFQSDVSDSYHSYEIYRSDGITEEDEHGNISIKPGIQARQVQSSMTKQLSVTETNLTMTQFPPISDTIVITYAKRLDVTKSN